MVEMPFFTNDETFRLFMEHQRYREQLIWDTAFGGHPDAEWLRIDLVGPGEDELPRDKTD